MSLDSTFHPLRIAEIRRETADSISVRFEAPDDLATLYRFEAGQHLTLRTVLAGEDLRRNYSLCTSPLDGELRIAIKLVADGRFSTWAHAQLQEGDLIEVMAPIGRFTWGFDPAASRRYVGFAGGSGITPVLSLLKTALRVEPQSRFTLFYGNRATASIMFLEDLAALKNRYIDRVQIYHFLEDEAEEIELFNGRLDAARCGTVLDQLVDVAGLDAVFICGPGPMTDAAEAALTVRGVPAERILIERFTTAPPSALQAATIAALVECAVGAKISVLLDGRRATIAFDPARGTILDNVRAAGLPAPFACKGGVCATCRAKVISGTAQMKGNYALTADEVAQGYVLTCQALPTSDDVFVTYDA
ncbi:MAG TPA: 2Fe-2S iron-sulfur cluster-binding protein [Alphaproteobacteria bacterium]|nr:2Fe-2S iron-sulfur cluster-binding protein [Alphaproteobacteria bacterium]